MPANRAGYLIASLILLIEIGAVAWALSLDRLSGPTAMGRDIATLAPMQLPIDPNSVVPWNQPGVDATDNYARALHDFQQRQMEYRRLAAARSAQLRAMPAFSELRSAAHANRGQVLEPRAEEVVLFAASDRLPLIRMIELGEMAIEAADLARESGAPDDARALYQAAFTLGRRMWEERLVYQEAEAGLTLMQKAATGLQQMAIDAGDTARAAALKEFNVALASFIQTRLWPMRNAILLDSDDNIRAHVGDLFVFASPKMQERMWRVEALFKLGVIRYRIGGGRRGDQVGAARVAKDIAEQDTDPIVQRAARIATQLTVEEFRKR